MLFFLSIVYRAQGKYESFSIEIPRRYETIMEERGQSKCFVDEIYGKAIKHLTNLTHLLLSWQSPTCHFVIFAVVVGTIFAQFFWLLLCLSFEFSLLCYSPWYVVPLKKITTFQRLNIAWFNIGTTDSQVRPSTFRQNWIYFCVGSQDTVHIFSLFLLFVFQSLFEQGRGSFFLSTQW